MRCKEEGEDGRERDRQTERTYMIQTEVGKRKNKMYRAREKVKREREEQERKGKKEIDTD